MKFLEAKGDEVPDLASNEPETYSQTTPSLSNIGNEKEIIEEVRCEEDISVRTKNASNECRLDKKR